MTKDIHNYFIPSLRQGLSAAINGPAVAHRAGIDIKLTAVARRKDTRDWDPYPLDVEKVLQLYGPGDILGFDERIAVRRHPEPDVGDFEPNYFPSIEFADADFAWRFTADRAEHETGKLKPWITLAVLASKGPGDLGSEFVELPRSDRNLPPQIAVSTAALPALQHSWRWAHVHITEESGKQDQLEQIIREAPEVAICRLLCARRLAPKTRYTAFVLPTFKLGVLAGLGLDLDPEVTALDKAWHLDDAMDKALPYHLGERPSDCPEWPQQLEEGTVVRLPYYYRWEFGTGLRGDFEHLVRLLEPRKLNGLGIRNIDCSAPDRGVTGVNREVQSETDDQSETDRHLLGMEGALRSLDTQYTRWGRDPITEPAREPAPLQVALAELVNEPRADQALPAFTFEAFDTAEIEEIAVRLHPSGTSATISWRTNQPAANSGGKYGEDTGCDPGHATCTDCSDGAQEHREHRVVLTDLASGTRYYFKIFAQTQTGVEYETPTCSFEMPPLPSVVPPIYGRWHSGQDGVVAEGQEQWLDVLNLDPRHRAAAGLGSEVVRKQQEPLMASAWDQLGSIESANDILRRAQFGRDTSLRLDERLGQLATEDFLRVTAPVLGRVIKKETGSDRKTTVVKYLNTQSRIPEAAFDPAFRRIIRLRGPIRNRQSAGRSVDLLTKLSKGNAKATRFELGEAPKPAGTITLCDIMRRMAQPKVSLTANPGIVGVGEKTTLSWTSTNTETCSATGWSVSGCSGSVEDLPFALGGGDGGYVGTIDSDDGLPDIELGFKEYRLTCSGTFGNATASVKVWKESTTDPIGGNGVSVTDTDVGLTPDEVLSKNFCENIFDCENLQNAVTDNEPFNGVPGAPDPDTVADAVCDTLNNWLDKPLDPAEEHPPIPEDADGFLEDLRKDVQSALNPNSTVLERTKNRLRLAGDLAQRFEEGATGDPLDPIMWAPEFPQPMYEPLRDISHQLLLPGVEKIPQNTLGLLQTNRRFLESYHCGLNHELAGELLWRGYPTDQQGSYFRQFWDVSEYIPRSNKRLGWLLSWIKRKTGQISTETDEGIIISAVSRSERERLLWRHADWTREQLEELWKTQPLQGDEEERNRRNKILSGIDGGRMSALSSLSDEEINAPGLASEMAIHEQIGEELKDVQRLTNWKSNKLGDNAMRPGEDLVLVVRGDLLKRYPNAVIYAVDAVPCDGNGGELVPALREYLKEVDGTSIDDDERVDTILEGRKRVFPVFRATLPHDMTFFGFPFSDEEARGTDGDGKFFLIEEQLAEPRFGLDVPEETPTPIKIWPDDLCWSHFGTEDGSFDFGRYLDNPPDGDLPNLQLADPPADPGEPEIDAMEKWQNASASAAGLAKITCQDPVRIAVHARQMLPVVAAYFELKGSDSDDRFFMKLVHPDKILHARKILLGEVTERLHIKGIVVSKPAAYNPDWSYHLDPDSITFVDSGMEACDATMRHVEDNLNDLGDLLLPDCIWCPRHVVLVQECKES